MSNSLKKKRNQKVVCYLVKSSVLKLTLEINLIEQQQNFYNRKKKKTKIIFDGAGVALRWWQW